MHFLRNGLRMQVVLSPSVVLRTGDDQWMPSGEENTGRRTFARTLVKKHLEALLDREPGISTIATIARAVSARGGSVRSRHDVSLAVPSATSCYWKPVPSNHRHIPHLEELVGGIKPYAVVEERGD